MWLLRLGFYLSQTLNSLRQRWATPYFSQGGEPRTPLPLVWNASALHWISELALGPIGNEAILSISQTYIHHFWECVDSSPQISLPLCLQTCSLSDFHGPLKNIAIGRYTRCSRQLVLFNGFLKVLPSLMDASDSCPWHQGQISYIYYMFLPLEKHKL